MIDEFLPEIDRLRSQSAVVIVKWDGKRSSRIATVVILRADTQFSTERTPMTCRRRSAMV